jgi:hypothetical protein
LGTFNSKGSEATRPEFHSHRTTSALPSAAGKRATRQMKITSLRFAALCGAILLQAIAISAQVPQQFQRDDSAKLTATAHASAAAKPSGAADSGVSEVELLKRRVEEIENQNRALMQIVADLKARLDASSHSEPAKPSVPAVASSRSASPERTQAPAPSNQSDKNQPPRWSDLIGEGNKFKFYGQLRLDMDFDTQRPNNTQTPLFITSPDPAAGGANIGEFSMHPRLTRFGIDYSGPHIDALGDARLSGKLETDFENGGSESRQIIRIRHAYLRLDWSDFSILAGQTWDIVSPLFPTVNNDTLQWNAGNVGDRRPQIRAAYEPKVGAGRLSFAGGAGLTGAIDSADLDNNGYRDGEESQLPNFQGRIGYSFPAGKDRTASFGFSGFYGFLETQKPIAGRTDFHSQLLNLDVSVPLASFLALRGEGWWGRNMSDVRGGAGQGINLANGREIRGRGGWSEANFKLSRYFSFNPGFSTDDPVDRDVPNGGRTRNQAWYLANRITPGGNFLIGADYLRWRTDFKGFRRGTDNRVNIFFQYSF